MSDSGPPKHWPFQVVEPCDFKMPERRITSVYLNLAPPSELLKEALVESINELALTYGWQGVTCHYIIDVEGNICTGRPLEEICTSLEAKIAPTAISVLGRFPSEKSMESANQLRAAMEEVFKLANRDVSFHGFNT